MANSRMDDGEISRINVIDAHKDEHAGNKTLDIDAESRVSAAEFSMGRLIICIRIQRGGFLSQVHLLKYETMWWQIDLTVR